MKYLKAFNESLDRNELREFCEMYLAYLLDKSHFNLEVFSSTKDILIIEILDNPDNTFSGDKIFTWLDVKDHIIPFLKMLDKSYDINIIRAFQYGKDHMSTGLMPHSIGSIEKLPDDTKMKSITISVSNKKSFIKKIKSFFSKNESVESVMSGLIEKIGKVVEDINNLCEQHLVYLQDDGFIYDIDLDHDGVIIKLTNTDFFSWDNINDRFIPFLIMLKKDFNIRQDYVEFVSIQKRSVKRDWFKIDTLCYHDDFNKEYILEINININI